MKGATVILVVMILILGVLHSTNSCEFSTNLNRYRKHDPTFMCSVGMHDGRVPDEDITASSTHPSGYRPEYARLYNQESFAKPGYQACWAAGQKASGEWIQVNLRKPTRITGIVTQGRAINDVAQYVISFKISFSDNGQQFTTIQSTSNTDQVFSGNTDNQTPVVNKFPQPVIAQFFRLVVQTWHEHPTLRLDLLICELDELPCNYIM